VPAQPARRNEPAEPVTRPLPVAPPAHTPPPRGVGRVGRLALAPFDSPGRRSPKPLGLSHGGPAELVGLLPADGRYHVHVIGVTGVGKSTFLASLVLTEAAAGRGVVLLDPQGDLALLVLERLPASCARRVVLLDPADTTAPPGFNPLAPSGLDPASGADEVARAREWAAETVAGTFKALYARWWGPRMDDIMRGACHTLVRRPGSTVLDIATLLTDSGFRRHTVHEYGSPPGLGTLWDDFEALSPTARAQLTAPLISRLRALSSRRFARDLLGAPTNTVDLTDILDGGVLLARLPKGELGDDACRLLGSLLLSCLWSHTTRRAARAPEQRPDATLVIDEAHNFLNLPIGIDEALAESRGYRVSWTLAHQHLDQLPGPVHAALSANARNKLYFRVAADDAPTLLRHLRPFFTSEHDLSERPAYQLIARIVVHGQPEPPFTLDTLPLPPAVAGHRDRMRAAAARNAGVPRPHRDHHTIAANPDGAHLLTTSHPARDPAPVHTPTRVPGRASLGGPLGRPPGRPAPPRSGGSGRARDRSSPRWSSW
jgi:hypothetical protein